MQLTCRFYKSQFPDVEDLVMVNVTEIEEMGVYVNLLEYNNRQGMILLTELSRRRIRSINKLIRVGRNEVVVVVRVDREKGYIDLSKRRVSAEDAIRCEEKFNHGKTVNSILRHTAEVLGLQTNEEFEELYEKTAWFYDEKYRRLGAAYDVFIRAVADEHELDDCPVDDNVKTILMNNIRRRLTPQAVKCRADIEVACYGYDGIDAVKAALREGLSASTEEMPVKINLIAPPLYVVTATSLDRNEGLTALKTVIDKVEVAIKLYGGIYKVKMAPKVVTAVDDAALREVMLDAEMENEERPGDDSGDSDENEDGGISGKLPGEDPEEPIETKKTSSQANHDDDSDDSNDE